MRETIAKRLRSFYIDVPALRPGTVGAYALALVSVGVATVLRLALDPYVEGAQFVTFFPAIIITTLISGFGAGFFCAVLSTAAADFFVLAPRFSFYPESSAGLVDLLLFGPLAAYSVILISRMRLAIEREQAERALRAGKDRLQLALDAAQLGWWQYDALRRVVSGDRRFKEIFDVAPDEVPLEEMWKRVHPDDAKRVWTDFQAALDRADGKPYAHEYRVQRNEVVRWVETHGLAYFEGVGRERRAAGGVGSVADITERKEREERDYLLIREVNHRARNMLSVVDAIAHQTVANSPQDYVEHVSERIRALAAQQDLLVRSEWHGVEVGDLARAQLSLFADLIGSRIVIQGAKLRLNPASAQAVGLAFHELATNAAKYGALSTGAGRVDVGWGTVGDTLTISWTERDGPPVSRPKRRGFGSTVMATMAERTVDGKVDLDYAPSGVTWRLTCPTANALQCR
jgi:PAS domain S-box-containing protein